jgi:hypothetical protein
LSLPAPLVFSSATTPLSVSSTVPLTLSFVASSLFRGGVVEWSSLAGRVKLRGLAPNTRRMRLRSDRRLWPAPCVELGVAAVDDVDTDTASSDVAGELGDGDVFVVESVESSA